MQIAIVDYGAGNIESVRNAFAMAGVNPVMARTSDEVLAADRLILPGVGAAGAAARELEARGLTAAIFEAVRQRGRPMLGICLGMQFVGDTMLEFGEHKGFGWLRGRVVHLREAGVGQRRVPHMGWSVVEPSSAAARFFQSAERLRTFYFCHSYTLVTDAADAVAAQVDYEVPLVAAILDGTVLATQFHPEKSQINGQHLIRSFLSWNP